MPATVWLIVWAAIPTLMVIGPTGSRWLSVACVLMANSELNERLHKGKQAALQALLTGNEQQMTAAQELLVQQARVLDSILTSLQLQLKEQATGTSSETSHRFESAAQLLAARQAALDPTAARTGLAQQNWDIMQAILDAEATAPTSNAWQSTNSMLEELAQQLATLREE